MSNPRKAERRKEREDQFEVEYVARLKEEARKEALTMWERIEESDASADVKDILHRLAERVGVDD